MGGWVADERFPSASLSAEGDDDERGGTGRAAGRDTSLQQGLVEQQRPGRGALLLQNEDEVPEVDTREPLAELLARGGGGARGGAAARAGRHLGREGGGAESVREASKVKTLRHCAAMHRC